MTGETGKRLTRAQRMLMDDVMAGDDRCVKVYAAANAIVVRGLAEWFDDDEYGGRLRLTEKGRVALSRARDGEDAR